MDAGPIELEWEGAAERVAEIARERRVRVIGVTGPVAAGKSTLAAQVAGLLNAGLLSTDHYLPDYALVPENERDLPERADLALLGEHLGRLRAGEAVDRPEWSFHEHRRVGVRRLEPTGLVVCEGIHALAHPVRSHVDLGVFVEASSAARWSRWEAIERAGKRGMGVERARAFFDGVAEPTFERFAAGYRASADVVVRNP